jgi:hypothetical protein
VVPVKNNNGKDEYAESTDTNAQSSHCEEHGDVAIRASVARETMAICFTEQDCFSHQGGIAMTSCSQLTYTCHRHLV